MERNRYKLVIFALEEYRSYNTYIIHTLGNPKELIDVSNKSFSDRLPPSLSNLPFNSTQITQSTSLSAWKDIEALKLLNLTYDITPAKFVSMVCCELGQIPSTLVLSVLRTQNQSLH